MRFTRTLILSAALVGGLLALPALADAQSRGRAVPRGSVRAGRPPAVRVAPLSRPFYYYRPYRPGLSLGFYYGYPWGWGSLAFGYPYFGYSPYYGYPYYGAYAYPGGYATAYPGYGVRAYGGVRIDVPQRDAEVTVDGYFAGTVNDFNGRFQQLDLEPGPHHIEIRANGFEPVSFDVNVEPGRTITYRAALRPARP
jgi:hypothetical protein